MASTADNQDQDDGTNAVIVMDRFVSASSSQDAVESLNEILKGLKSGNWQQDWIFEQSDLMEALLKLLQHGTIGDDNTDCGEEGVPLVCQIFLQLKDHPSVLTKPTPGRLLEALLDVMEPGEEGNIRSAYTRVLALQVLKGISKGPRSMSKASTQWLEAPNGLHRLADLIDITSDTPTEEVVRNEALLVLRLLATQAPMAKVFLFAELDVKLLEFCWHIGGGLTKGSTTVLDALELILELYQHADKSLQSLVWERPSVAPRLAQLLDLRGGDEFLHPPKDGGKARKKKKASPQDYDLDDLLGTSSSDKDKKKDNKEEAKDENDFFIPRLLDSEEKVVHLVLKILNQLMDNESLRPMVYKQHVGLCSLLWELALMGPPTPVPPCARPSSKLQQAALEFVATKMNDRQIMDRMNGLDRLLRLVVTGNRFGEENQDSSSALGISQAALSVLRNTLDADRIHEILLFTISPPPPVDEDDQNPQPPPGPTVVEKLWNTVAQNLSVGSQKNDDGEAAKTETANDAKHTNRALFLSGALGGLSLFLTDEESREMMFKVMTVTMDQFLETLETEKDEMVQWTLFRFLCEWIFQSPLLVQTLLSSTMSAHLATMAATQGKSTNPLLYLLLGLSMDSMITATTTTTDAAAGTADETQTNYGGWTRDGIFQVLQGVGIAKITTRLENLTKKTTDFPWSVCAIEFKTWKDWYQKAVWIVRKRIVEEMARSGGGDSDSDEEEIVGDAATPSKPPLYGAQSSDLSSVALSSTPSTPAGSNKTLHKLLNQQSREMEGLRQELEEAKSKIAVQESQLVNWKRRNESTPTELDTMLNEVTTRNSDLEETIRKLQAEAKEALEKHEVELKQRDDAIAEQRQEAERLRIEEQEARDDRDRMEQELQGVSQAYAALEAEFRQHQSAPSSTSGAPTGESSDGVDQQSRTQAGEGSQQEASASTVASSTEVLTLREEINRLRSENERQRTSAREADDWMQMAVQRMNDMGANNANLQNQVTTLQGQLHEQHQQAQQTASSSGDQAERISALESQLQQELSLRQGAEAQLTNATGELEIQKQQIQQLQNQLSSVYDEVRMVSDKAQADTAELERQLEEARGLVQQQQTSSDESGEHQQTISELQQQLSNVQERSKATTEQLQARVAELQGHLEVAQQQQPQEPTPDAGEAELLQQLQNIIASKDVEIQSLQSSLEQAKSEKAAEGHPANEGNLLGNVSIAPATAESESLQQHLEAAKEEAEEINRRSQEEIYKKEARIRELEDRLSSGMGGYTIEDIRERDEEIEELRTANEAAQDWMAKAVEHHQLLTNQLRTMTEEKAKLECQINESMGGEVASNASEAALKLLESQLEEKIAELKAVRSTLAAREQEMALLKNSGSGLEQDLGIARDDLGNLQRQLNKAEETVKSLEARLAENELSAENETLRESNEDLSRRLEEFQSWADTAQTKIAEILAAKENAEKLLAEANERLNSTLEKDETGNGGDFVALHAKLAEIESINKALSADCEAKTTELTELQGHYNELQAWTETAQQKIVELSSANAQSESTPNQGGDEQTNDVRAIESSSPADKLEELESLQKQYADLEKTYKDLQTWADTIPQKIKDLESSLAAANEEASSGRREILTLNTEIDTEKPLSSHSPSQPTSSTAKDFLGSGNKDAGGPSAEDFFGGDQAKPETTDAGDFFSGGVATTDSSDSDDSGNIVDFLRNQLRQKEGDLKSLQEKVGLLQKQQTDQQPDSESVVRKWEDRVDELESELHLLREQMTEQEEEANGAIRLWQESFAEIEKKCVELEARLEAGAGVAQTDNRDDEAVAASKTNRVAELESEVESLKKQIADQLSDDESVVRKWEDRVAELENELIALQEQMVEQEQAANNAINEWQESFADAEKKCTDLESMLEATQQGNATSQLSTENEQEGIESSTRDLDEKIASLENAIDAEMDDLHQAETESAMDDAENVESLKEELKKANENLGHDEEIVTQWEDRVAELGATVEELQKQLQEQEEEANGVISQWQDSYNDAEQRCGEMEKELERLRDGADSQSPKAEGQNMERTPNQTRDQDLIAKIDNLELELAQATDALSGDEDVVNQWEARVAELETVVKSLEAKLEEQERDSNKAISEWEQMASAADETAQGLEEKLSALLEEKFELLAANSEVEDERSALSEKLAELESRLGSTENASRDQDELPSKLSKSEEELAEAKESLKEAEDIAHQWEEQCASLESQIQIFETQLNEQEEEAKNALQQWQDSYTELEQKLESLEGSKQSDVSHFELEQLQTQLASKNYELSQARQSSERDVEAMQQWEERCMELESSLEGLRSQLDEQGREAESAISSWQDKNSKLQLLCNDLESRLSAKEEELLEKISSIEGLTAQLEDTALKSNTQDELESSVREYIAENAKLHADIESQKEARRGERERLEAQLADERGRHAEARDEIDELSKVVEQMRNDSEDVVNQWTERVDELTGTVQDLEVQLSEQETEANQAISSWEEKYNELESELEACSEMIIVAKEKLGAEEDAMVLAALEDVIRSRDNAIQEIESSNERIQRLNAQITHLEKSLENQKPRMRELEVETKKEQAAFSELNDRFAAVNKRCEELKRAKETAEAALEEKSKSEASVKNELNGLKTELEYIKEDRSRMKEIIQSKSHEKLEEERDRLAVVVTQLQEELREANNMTQAYVTDGSTTRATELAAEALRDEIEYLRNQIDEYRATAENEKTAREASDMEIERLRHDITALVALGEDGMDSVDIDVLSARASEKMNAKERQEIDQIRKSLYRAIDELELARAAEKEANEKLSKARLQNSVCEQEIVAAKSEILFLTQALEDMRLAEEGKRASLEYHINSLEDEMDVIRKYKSDEFRDVSNELSQVSMDRDRILNQLKEAEKANETLIMTSKSAYGDNEAAADADEMEEELAKLRVENAYLLTVSANEKARAERRLREMLGAQASSTDADTILEHELRIASEATIQTLKVEIEQLKARVKDDEIERKATSSPSRSKNKEGGQTDQIENIKKEIHQLKKENSGLKSKLEKEAAKARTKIDSLTEECRQAQAKIHKLQRQGRFDAAVKSEIGRIRMSPGMSTPERRQGTEHDENWMLVGNNDPATMDARPDGIMTSAEAFDLINKQKEEIQEERLMYLEFLSEHEDLLALLAQHDVERACLKRFMAERLGEEAVDQAIREAEEKSKAKFGQTIRVS